MVFGHKLNINSGKRFGHKTASPRSFGHKSIHYKGNSQTLDDGNADPIPKSDLERNNTREHHGYHNTHNHLHR
jgi:hypothetical protein